MKIYYLMFDATPTTDHDEYDEIGGAFINCWVRANSEDTAMSIAVKTLSEYCWKILKVEDTFIATAERYQEDPESLECFNEAVEQGESYFFHEWPNEPQEEDKIH